MTELNIEPLQRLSKDLKKASATMTIQEIRYLVDLYYQVQDFRIQAAAQKRIMEKEGEPATVIDWFFTNQRMIENSIKSALDVYTDLESTGMGAWAKSICGIGPVISAGLLAHIDIMKAPTVGHIWAFAGMDPTKEWKKGEKRPWNARLKVLCWKLGESFVKVQNNPKDIYGKLFVKKRKEEDAANELGKFAEQAKLILEKKDFKRDTGAKKAYLQGKLPPAHLHARARRWCVKIFLYHWFAEAYRRQWKKEPPLPWIIEHGGHAHLI